MALLPDGCVARRRKMLMYARQLRFLQAHWYQEGYVMQREPMIKTGKRAVIDWWLVMTLLAIMGLGFVNLASASAVAHAPYQWKQLAWYVIGTGGLIFFAVLDYRMLALYAGPIFWGTCGLLGLVLFAGRTIGGSQRWLDLGFFNLQPSEIAKLAMVIVLSKYFFQEERPAYGIRELARPLVFTIVPSVLIMKQPDLGTALMLVAVLVSMVYFARLRWTSFLAIFTLALALLPLGWKLLKPYQKDRLLTFFNPERDPFGSGYHVIQSKIAIGSGGVWGKGFMHGTQAHLNFLPEVHTDFAFSLWGEEWGFAGCLLLMILYMLVVYRGFRIAAESRERFGAFLAFGVTAVFFWQALVNMCMVVGLMPVVGIPLPLFSYGGSSVLVTLAGMGLLFNVRARRFLFQNRKG